MEYLLTSEKTEAVQLCDHFVFKIIPMLNVDGVVNGSHRCSLAGVDLNRTWDRPSAILHPAVFHTKAVVQYMVSAYSIFNRGANLHIQFAIDGAVFLAKTEGQFSFSKLALGLSDIYVNAVLLKWKDNVKNGDEIR